MMDPPGGSNTRVESAWQSVSWQVLGSVLSVAVVALSAWLFTTAADMRVMQSQIVEFSSQRVELNLQRDNITKLSERLLLLEREIKSLPGVRADITRGVDSAIMRLELAQAELRKEIQVMDEAVEDHTREIYRLKDSFERWGFDLKPQPKNTPRRNE